MSYVKSLYCTVRSAGSSAACTAGRKDLRYLSFTHLGCIGLLLKELPGAEIVACRERDSLTSSDDSWSIILLSATTCTGSRGHPRKELTFLISLSSLLLSAAEMQLLHRKQLMPPQSHRKLSGVYISGFGIALATWWDVGLYVDQGKGRRRY